MANKDNIIRLGNYDFKITRENQTSGLTYYLGDNYLVDDIKNFYKDLFNLDFVPEKDIRGYKKVDKYFFKFVSGHGYDIFDADILNYNGSGILKNLFLDYNELNENKNANKLTLSKINLLKKLTLNFLEINKKFKIPTQFVLNESYFKKLEEELQNTQKKEQTLSM